MPGGERIVAHAITLFGDTRSLGSAGLVLAHEKTIDQRYRDRHERQDVNRAGGVKDEKPQDIEENQGYKDYPGHYLLRPIGITFEYVRMIAESRDFFN